jgi:hypothetical protein
MAGPLLQNYISKNWTRSPRSITGRSRPALLLRQASLAQVVKKVLGVFGARIMILAVPSIA